MSIHSIVGREINPETLWECIYSINRINYRLDDRMDTDEYVQLSQARDMIWNVGERMFPDQFQKMT